MGLILRADVDKPYGYATLTRRILSKLVEDYIESPLFIPSVYLIHLNQFLEYCNENSIPAYIYCRLCTTPNEKVLTLLEAGGHKLGFHAEDTRSYEAFLSELTKFKIAIGQRKVNSFTKHGSGKLKLGKHHYAPYEPEKYKEWVIKAGIGFYFGNGTSKSASDLYDKNGYFENMFCVEKNYRNPSFFDLEDLLLVGERKDVVVSIHPCHFNASLDTAHEFKRLIKLAKERNIPWKLI